MKLADAIKPSFRGKVRDTWDLFLYGMINMLLILTTDRISTYDVILPEKIPHKGQVLNQLTIFWMNYLKDIVPNHNISTDIKDLPKAFACFMRQLANRFVIAKKAKVFPIECIARGYLTGSAYDEYVKTGKVCGIELPKGLKNGSKLKKPIFTPSTKAAYGEKDENITFERMCELIGKGKAKKLRKLTLQIYSAMAAYALKRGIIIADTKLEFGIYFDEKLKKEMIILIDEVGTPDSSRFWDVDEYRLSFLLERDIPSFDKQYVRDYLVKEMGWDKKSTPPPLSSRVIENTTKRYIEAYERLTGEKFKKTA